jgi:hypothetical protein
MRTHCFTPTLLSLFHSLKIKLKDCHFDTLEVIKTFKNGRSAGNGAYVRKGTISRVMVVSRPKVSF